MTRVKRHILFWIIIVLLLVLLLLLLLGQTMAIIDYDLAVSLGFQESVKDVGK